MDIRRTSVDIGKETSLKYPIRSILSEETDAKLQSIELLGAAESINGSSFFYINYPLEYTQTQSADSKGYYFCLNKKRKKLHMYRILLPYLHNKGLKCKTVRCYHAFLHGAVTYAVKADHITINPT